MTERVLRVERRSYSRGPWRIIDSETGREVTHLIYFDHPHLGEMPLQEAGFDTKAEAIDELGRLAARWVEHVQKARAS